MISKNIVEHWIMGYLTIIIQGIDLDMELYCDSPSHCKIVPRPEAQTMKRLKT
jgi:hypothetical protein